MEALPAPRAAEPTTVVGTWTVPRHGAAADVRSSRAGSPAPFVLSVFRGMPQGQDILLLFVLALPVASVTWTMTHEEIFREWRDWCAARRRASRRLLLRKFFY